MLPSSSQARRDVYANLLRDTRGLRRDQATAREAWFASLPWERKEETLFELEMLLKGLVCFGNPRNLAGPPRRSAGVAHDFHQELRVVRLTTDRIIDVVRELLGDRDRAFTFTRYLESVMPEDAERSRLVREQLTQDTPIEALFVLRNTFTSLSEIGDGLLRLGRISHRLFSAYHGTLTREIGRNAYFNPLMALEFRSEFDRIRSIEVLEALENVPSDTAHRVASLTFLTLFRALRYLDIVERYAVEDDCVPLCYVILAVFRSDLRTLTRYLARRSSDAIADGFERELLHVEAHEIVDHYGELAAIANTLMGLRNTLDAIQNSLRIEVRKTFERDLPAPEGAEKAVTLGPKMIVAAADLRATLHYAVRTLCAELRPRQPVPELASTDTARRASSERLRRDVWMFGQVLRAFLAKARATQGDADRWAAQASFRFVGEFLRHFRAIGYQLVRTSDYERLDPFLDSLEKLRGVDLLDDQTLREAIGECDALFKYLEGLFKSVSGRGELSGITFDRRGAAETLKIYLGAA